jgi:antitoxin (DNA-binding transcriptional repressor) of toxin-antitoxin stability system
LTSDHIEASMLGMKNVVGIRNLRRGVNESLVRVSRGETIVVARHGHPIAIIRPLDGDETGQRVSVTTFRRNLRRALAVTRRRAIVLTWYGESVAVVAPVPPDFDLDDSEEEESA